MKEFIYGRNPVLETIKSGRRQTFQLLVYEGAQEKNTLGQALDLARQHGIPILRTNRQQLDKLSDHHQGLALEVDAYPYVNLADIQFRVKDSGEPAFILILDSLQNPQNLGTLLRTAEVVGVHGVVIPGHRAAEITPAVVSASAGASEHMLVAQANLAQAISQLKSDGAWVIGLDEDPGSSTLEQVSLEGPLVLVVGSEGEGLRPLVRRECDLLMRLPMRGQVGSLNAAVAGSVALYLAYLTRTKNK